MTRRLLTTLTGLSLLLCAASAGLWAVGPGVLWTSDVSVGAALTHEQMQARMDRFGTASAEVQWSLTAEAGRLALKRYHYGDPTLRGGPGRAPRRGVVSGETFFRAPVSGGGFVPGSIRWYAVPLWPVVAASAVLPAIAARSVLHRRRRRARRERGLCPACAYDLRATPGRCPECEAVL
jgi:hypothetical protein